MDYVFLVLSQRDRVVVELHVLTNSVGEVCAVRRADGEDGWRYVGDLRRAGHLAETKEWDGARSYTVAKR